MPDKETAKEEIRKLVEKYNRLVESGKLKSYNEEMTKKDFILPLFRALGWDVENGEEVTAEEKISKGRVDYAFRIEGIPKLFLEAKALKVDLDRVEFAEQAINYAWHKGATWAILTDFEAVKVFNSEWKSQNPLQNMFFGINCSQFLDRFEQLWLLSRESLEKGLIDNEAEKWGKKAKKIPVDKQLLSDLTKFRELLTKNILKNNAKKELTGDELDEAVQRILDRLLFIRTLEDKQLEAPVLQALIREDTHKRVFKNLNDLFRKIDDVYNSKLFRPHLCEDLILDDDLLEKVIRGLFKTADNTVHYDFGAIDADVLGNMYEQYLGHILKKTEKRAKLAEGKAHRKEQGIYYTPTYVVDYIVKNTVEELAKNKKFDLKSIKILDPACGSGSFLMKAFDYLVTLDKKKNGDIDQTRLDLTGASATYGRKVEILKENIFGVDLDPKAVEIAQLNLLLKIAEKKHRLPTLQENINVGNSLVENKEISAKAFEWDERFEEIMKSDGFDVIIGNPPWVSLKGKHKSQDVSDKELNYYFEKYKCDTYMPNLYEIFIWRCLSLIKDGGYFSFIVPDRLCANKQFTNLRNKILEEFDIQKLWFKVPFPGVIADTVVFVVKKGKSKNNKIMIREFPDEEYQKIPQKVYEGNQEKSFFYITKEIFNIFEKINENKLATTLSELVLTTSGCGAKSSMMSRDRKNDKQIKVMKGENIGRFENRGFFWFEFSDKNLSGRTRDISKLGKKYKVLLRKTGLDLIATFDDGGIYPEQSLYFLYTDKDDETELLYYLTGILNSKLLNCYYRYFAITNRDSTPQLKNIDLDKFPIIISKKDEIIDLVKNLLKLHSELNRTPKNTDKYHQIEESINKTEGKLNDKIYSIYNLTKDEIKIVEESLKD